MIKNPVKGRVKTRLAAEAGEDYALRVYQALLDRTRKICLEVDAVRYLLYSDWIETQDGWSDSDFHKRRQRGSDLGTRMQSAFAEALEQHDQAVIIGSDNAQLNTRILDRAFEDLEHKEAVIGPAPDGGYYLLGLRKVYPLLFESMPWSTDQVYPQTIERFHKLGLQWAALPECADIDYLSDWQQHGWPLEEKG